MPKAKSAKSKKPVATKATNGSASKAAAAPTQSKADFVRSLPPELSAKEVLAKAKEAGIKIGENYVYALRPAGKRPAAKHAPAKPAPSSPAKARAKRPTGPTSAQRQPHLASAAPAARTSSRETDFARLVLDLGFERVDALLVKIKRTVGTLTAGA